MIDALKSYAALASGLTEVTAAKAKDVAGALVEQVLVLSGRGTDITGKVTDLADDLLATSKENREAITAMVRTEVDRAVGRVGFVREDELAALRRHVQRLEAEIGALRDEGRDAGRIETARQTAPVAEVPQGAAPAAVVVEETAPLSESVGELVGEAMREAVAEQAADVDAAPTKKTKTWIAE